MYLRINALRFVANNDDIWSKSKIVAGNSSVDESHPVSGARFSRGNVDIMFRNMEAG